MRSNSGFKRFLVVLTLALCQVLLYTPVPADAADSTVRVAGQSVFSVASGAGGYSASARAAMMQRNIDNALIASTNRGPSAVTVSYVNGQPVLTLGGFYIATVDGASARVVGMSPAMLADRWANGLRGALSNSASVDAYVAQLSGGTVQDTTAFGTTTNSTVPSGTTIPYYRQGRVVFVPAGMTIPVTLSTSISSNVAQPGDTIEARVSESISLGEVTIPAGSTVTGQITDAEPGRRLARSGTLGMQFNKLRLPDGSETPITATIISGVAKYAEKGEDQFKGETTGTKVKKTLIHGAVGAGAGALLGTAVGAIAGHGGRGAGRGAWSGAAIGGGVGVINGLVIRKGTDVKIQSGERMTLQLQAPASIAVRSVGVL